MLLTSFCNKKTSKTVKGSCSKAFTPLTTDARGTESVLLFLCHVHLLSKAFTPLTTDARGTERVGHFGEE